MPAVIRAAIIAALVASPATAQNTRPCFQREALIETLAAKYGEARQVVALDGQGRLIEIFANVETGSWTLTVSLPSGVTCMMRSGLAFERDGEVSPLGDKL